MRHIVLFTAWRLTTERPAWTSPVCAEKFCYKKSYERAQLVKAQSRCLWNIDVDRVSVAVDSSKGMFISARTASISWIFPWAMGCCVIIAWFCQSLPPLLPHVVRTPASTFYQHHQSCLLLLFLCCSKTESCDDYLSTPALSTTRIRGGGNDGHDASEPLPRDDQVCVKCLWLIIVE